MSDKNYEDIFEPLTGIYAGDHLLNAEFHLPTLTNLDLIPKEKRLCVAVDSSKHSLAAFEWAYLNLANDGDSLIIIHIFPSDIHMGHSDDLKRQHLDSVQFSLKSECEEIINKLNKVKKVDILTNVKDDICVIASELQAKALVLGTRGLSSIQGLLLGSVSSYCTKHCAIPVCVVPIPQQEKKKLEEDVDRRNSKGLREGGF
ncbi:hypothetical protein HK099_001478 [Clydaea vesicula]|uniref:UspA domain-containing protein n=1 Tax=Clydaea vesicula TaxID=447962 RepID=A0AAD5XS17_9FUNG|nr:hypothetical protein HK099_001478 [Clydaea vesicula]